MKTDEKHTIGVGVTIVNKRKIFVKLVLRKKKEIHVGDSKIV